MVNSSKYVRRENLVNNNEQTATHQSSHGCYYCSNQVSQVKSNCQCSSSASQIGHYLLNSTQSQFHICMLTHTNQNSRGGHTRPASLRFFQSTLYPSSSQISPLELAVLVGTAGCYISGQKMNVNIGSMEQGWSFPSRSTRSVEQMNITNGFQRKEADASNKHLQINITLQPNLCIDLMVLFH